MFGALVCRLPSVLCIGAMLAALGTGDKLSGGHYTGAVGDPVRMEVGYRVIREYFGDKTPERIHVVAHPGDTRSRFDPATNTIHAGLAPNAPGFLGVVVHESAHLALAAATGGASTFDEFRFIDEGMATTVENEAMNTSGDHRASAVAAAAGLADQGRLSLATVKDWPSFFGRPGVDPDNALNWKAYRVGASFIAYVLEQKGKPGLMALWRAVGETRSLDAALRRSLGIGEAAAEEEWRSWVAQNRIRDAAAPNIVRLMPEDNADGVPTNLREITAEFDQPMDTDSIVIVTPCGDSGVCYSNAYWKSSATLAVRVDLRADRDYRLQIGMPGMECANASHSARLPPTPWRFRTGSK
jgi:hypothetical protein